MRQADVLKELHRLSRKKIITEAEKEKMYRLRDEYIELTGHLPPAPKRWGRKKAGV